MWRESFNRIFERFSKRKKLYGFLILSALIIAILGSVVQFFFFLRGKQDWVCDGIGLSFYRNYSYVVVNGRMYECERLISMEEQAILCLLSELTDGYRSYALIDTASKNLYLAVGHRERPPGRDDCFMAGMAYSPTFRLCVEAKPKKCVLAS